MTLRPLLVAFLFSLSTAPAWAQQEAPNVLTLGADGSPVIAPGRLTVAGEGRAEVVPDIARLSVAVVEEADSAAAALNRASVQMTSVLGLLVAAGLPSEDVQTAEIQLWPLFPERQGPGRAKPEGFRASSTLNLTIRDLGALGDMLDAVVAAGVSEIHGLNFDVSDPGAAMEEARNNAVADARRRAETYAAAAGVDLGVLVSLTDGMAPDQPMPMGARLEMMDASMPVAPGTMALTATVSAVWSFSDND